MALSSLDPQPRGYAFEGFLKRVLMRSGFCHAADSERLANRSTAALCCWRDISCWKQNAQRPDTGSRPSRFQGKLNARVNWARGLFVSYSGFTLDGLLAYGRGGSVICMDGLDLHDALKGRNSTKSRA